MGEPDPSHAAAQRLMRRLDGFARELGLDGPTTQAIVEKVLADMPTRTEDERLMEARKRVLLASA
ncbi:hypothetical protein ACRAWG_39375 (plasmid) [Methylobacterium sp. P31]